MAMYDVPDVISVSDATTEAANIDQSLVYVTHPELQEAINGVKIEVPDASLTKKDIVQLSNATDGTRANVATTEKAVKTAAETAQTNLTNHITDFVKHPFDNI
ncbi:tail fiber protein [Paenibacillus dendrobii]|uniref:tail fiber protein n=1 Tax=Paenibacillus dendrobii TaxID=2691084 RepID=UPI00311AA9B0